MSLKKQTVDVFPGTWGWDSIAAAFGLAFAVLLFPMRFFVSQILVTTVPIVLGAASALYLVTERYGFENQSLRDWRLSAGMAHVLRMTVLVGLAAMVFVAMATGGRTLAFLGVASVVGTLIFVQIFFVERRGLYPTAVLAQIVGFALVLRWMALLLTPSLIGVDSWVHLPEYASSVRDAQSLVPINDTKYFGSPFYHLLVVVAADAFDASLRTGLYATLGIVMPVSILLIYFLTRYMLPVRWALFAAAAFAVSDHVVRWGLHLIPTSMGLVFFIAVFYAVTRIYATRGSLAMYGLVLFFTLATILTHQISTFVVLVFLGAGAAIQFYLRVVVPTLSSGSVSKSDSYVNFIGLFLLSLGITVVNWSLSPRLGTSFLEGMIGTATERLAAADFLEIASASNTVSEGPVTEMIVAPSTAVQVFDSLGFLALLLVTLVGVYTLLRHMHLNLLPLTWIAVAIVMMVVTLGLPLFDLNFFVPDRWYAFMYVPMIVIAAYGLRHVESHLPSGQVVVLLLVFALVFTAPMLMNHSATRDNPVHDDYYSKFAYSDSEIEAADTVASLHPSDRELQTDHPYYIFFADAEGVTAEPLALDAEGETTGDHVVYREYQSTGGPQVGHDDATIRVQLASDQVCRSSMDVVYANGDVQYCR